ncbi:MAG: hypothetical protein DMD72_00040 [Gemmatimonadetes bacterium]|nr:MAG: hypothetical protein DMD72_00040 [Gemmatimonadota bacterium]
MSSACSPFIASPVSCKHRRPARETFLSSRKAMMRSESRKHFGFRLTDPRDIDKAAAAIEKAGGKIKHRGEFVPGEPYVFFSDPDGYEVEVWYELPTDSVR